MSHTKQLLWKNKLLTNKERLRSHMVYEGHVHITILPLRLSYMQSEIVHFQWQFGVQLCQLISRYYSSPYLFMNGLFGTCKIQGIVVIMKLAGKRYFLQFVVYYEKTEICLCFLVVIVLSRMQQIQISVGREATIQPCKLCYIRVLQLLIRMVNSGEWMG